MPVKTFRPLTPSTRYIAYADYSDITKTRPEKDLVETRKRTGGRNVYGRVTARGIGGGNKQKIRLVDFKRNKHGVEATVAAIEYDPRRTARLALLQYANCRRWLSTWWQRLPYCAFGALLGIGFAAALVFVPARYKPFIYFQF